MLLKIHWEEQHEVRKVAENKNVHHYFVDEAGDLTLFNKRGQLLIGREGVSRVFMVGIVHLPDPKGAHRTLEDLRAFLLKDSYFKGVPSMQADGKKTAIAFHAKDDLPEVRREVFKVLPSLGAKVQIAIRRKSIIAAEARIVYQRSGRKVSDHSIYDDLVKRLFKNVLHKADENRIVFAHRGKAARQTALEEAIRKAKRNYQLSHGLDIDQPTSIRSNYPSEFVGLQVVDYYLWALQRVYERGEDRYFQLLTNQYRLVMDLDDKRSNHYGEWYSDSNPLRLEKIKPVVG